MKLRRLLGGNVIQSSSTVIVNDKTITVKGNNQNISVVNGHVYVNGKELDETKNVECVKLVINGNVGDVSTASADIEISGDVTGNVSTTSGDVSTKGNIGGSVKTTSGDVQAKSINGSVSTISGDIDKSFL